MIQVMAEWKRQDYENMYKKLSSICTRMELRKAIERAARRAADKGVTETKKELSGATTLKSGDIGQRVRRYQYGSPLGMVIGMRISDAPRALTEFAHWPKNPKRGDIPTVSVYKSKKTKLTKKAFFATMKTGHIGIFERKVDGSRGIRQLYGPSTTGLFKANEEIHNHVWDEIWGTFEKRVLHELHFILEGKND
jgi:hypothetical protein